MTIQDLGSIGELIAAIATVVTLGYLALQIRANSRLMRAEARRSAKGHASQINLAVAHDIQVAGVFRRGVANYESLEPDEQIQFTFLLMDYLSQADSAFSERRFGLDGGEDFSATWDGIRPLLLTSGGRAVWRLHNGRIGSPEFRAFVESDVFDDEPSGGRG